MSASTSPNEPSSSPKPEGPLSVSGEISQVGSAPFPVLMPLISSSFLLGHAREHAESLADPDARAIALSELAYFQGRPEDALELSAPYLESKDVGLRSSACFISAYSCLPLNRIANARDALAILERQAENARGPEAPVALFARDAALSLLHLDEGKGNAPALLAAQGLSEGVRMFLANVRAHQAYLRGDYGQSLGIVEGALSMASALFPIPALYLHLVGCMSAMSLKQIDYAKSLFIRAWDLAKPDGLIQGIAEHHGLLGGLIETCVKPVDADAYRRIIDITYRFSAGWRRVHNPRMQEEVADNLTTTEFSIAMLLNRGWTIREIASFLTVSENTVKTHTRHVYAKLGIKNRRELSRFMLR